MTAPLGGGGDGADAAVLVDLVRALVAEVHPHAAPVPVTLDRTFDDDLGLGSLELVELLMRTEDVFGVTLPSEVLATSATPRDLLGAVRLARSRPARPRAAVRAPAPGRQAARAATTAPQGPAPGRAAATAAATVPVGAASLVEALDWHVQREAGRLHIRLLDEVGAKAELTYGELRGRAASVAAGLADRGVGPGDTVAIMLPTGTAYFETFTGVLVAGAVPVPIYPPSRPSQLAEHLARQARILANAATGLLVTVPAALPLARALRANVTSLRQVVVPEALHGGEGGPVPRRAGTDLALVQYTSGSTGHPKGVALSHDNLLANIRTMGGIEEVSRADTFVSWLPLYHDMGLIGAWLSSLYFGFPLVVMPPEVFLTRPSRWLWAIHEHRGTISAAPNFAYELCLSRIADDEIRGLDLSSWRLAFNGAEPVSAATIERFAARFAGCGLRREAIAPVYGLAEASVGLTFPPLGRGPVVDRVEREPFARSGRAVPAARDAADAFRFVACGLPLPGHEVRIVDRAGNEVGDRQEGRIEFRGPSATAGYYRNDEATRALVHGAWLDTGDLGYVADGELHVTGRVKDVVIRAGRNLHPDELEEAVGNLDGVRKGCVAVFASPDPRHGTERLVVLAESRLTDEQARDDLRAAVVATTVDLLGTPPDDVVLAPPRTVLKTSSGKIRRAASRERYERGEIGARPRAAWWQLARFRLRGVVPSLREAGRAAAALAFTAWALVLLGAVGVGVAALLAVTPGTERRRRLARRAVTLLARLTGTAISVEGLDRIPSGPAVVVANHPSWLDGFVLAMVLPASYRFVVGEVFRRRRVSGFVLRRVGALFVERDEPGRGVADTGRLVEVVRAGQRLVLFPEGRLARAPGLRPFHMGAFVVAAEAGVPIVPVAIRGTRSMLRPGHALVRRGAVQVAIGEPVAPTGSDWADALALERAARAAVLRWCGEPDLD